MSRAGFTLLTAMAVATAGFASANIASATTVASTIIGDNFSTAGSGGYLLGQTPEVAPAGESWSTHAYYGTTPESLTAAQEPTVDTTAGTAYFPGTTNNMNVDGSIAFTPSTSGLLSLTATFNNITNNYAYMGFANSAATADPWIQASLYVLVIPTPTPTTTPQKFIFGTGTVGSSGFQLGEGYSKSPLNTPTPYTITYDPTTLQAALYVNGSSTAAFTKTLSNPLAIGSIFIGSHSNATSNFSNVLLTQQVVPEPATLGLFAVGAIGLLLRNRAKQRMA